MTDDPLKDPRAIVPRAGGELTKPSSGLASRGLKELSSLRPIQVTVPLLEGARVLVCDDEEAIVEVWGKILVDAGYEVRSTLNSIEAIEIAREFQPHVALLGLIMPRMDGIKSGLELMKVLPRTKVVITTESEPKDLETFRERGWTFDVLPWNSGKEELLEKTRAWVREAMHPEHPRILVVSTEEGFNEGVTEQLNRNGYIATSTGTRRKVHEIIEEAKTFQPDIVILYQDVFLWPKVTGVDIAILLLETFPGALFLMCRSANDQFPVSEEAWFYARSHGCSCEPFNIFDDELLPRITAWSTNRKPVK